MKSDIPIALFLALGAVMEIGCEVPPEPGTLSPVFTNFDLQRQFAARGFLVEGTTGPGRVGPKEDYGWRPMQGSIELPRDSSGCESVAQAVRDALNQAVDGPYRDELTQPPERRPGEPFYGMLRYSNDGIRGLVYVWLFPDETETRIKYAIILHEEQSAKENQSI